MNTIFGMVMCPNNILAKFDCQGHQVKKHDFLGCYVGVWGIITVSSKPRFHPHACAKYARILRKCMREFCARPCVKSRNVILGIYSMYLYGLRVSIHHGKRTLGQRNFATRVAGSASTLRRFQSIFISHKIARGIFLGGGWSKKKKKKKKKKLTK